MNDHDHDNAKRSFESTVSLAGVIVNAYCAEAERRDLPVEPTLAVLEAVVTACLDAQRGVLNAEGCAMLDSMREDLRGCLGVMTSTGGSHNFRGAAPDAGDGDQPDPFDVVRDALNKAGGVH